MRVEQWPNGTISLRDEHGTERVWLVATGDISLCDEHGFERVRLWADGSIWFRDDGGRLRAEWTP